MIELILGIIPKENIHSITKIRRVNKGLTTFLLLVNYCKGKTFHTIEMGSEYSSDRNSDYEKLKKEILKS